MKLINKRKYDDYITILMPCLNEAETLEVCIKKAQKFLKTQKFSGEVLIADNGSNDGSQKIALDNKARLINVKQKGYGSALMAGIESAKGKYIIMGDADDSYDFSDLTSFIDKLEKGYDLVMGNRFKGGIKKGAMPPLHRYIGNPILSGIGKLFFKSPINDFHSGLRAFKRDSIMNLELQTTGMEYASEMVVKATLFKLKITEVPIILFPDGRSRKPHLRSWRDGWRHLRFLLLYSPKWLFYLPGILIFLFGLVIMTILSFGEIRISSIVFGINTMVFSSLFIILGFNLALLGLYTNIFTMNSKITPPFPRIRHLLAKDPLEKGILLGVVLSGLGFIGSFYSFYLWYETGFGNLIVSDTLRAVIPSTTLFIVGVQIIFASFFTSVLNLQIKTNR